MRCSTVKGTLAVVRLALLLTLLVPSGVLASSETTNAPCDIQPDPVIQLWIETLVACRTSEELYSRLDEARRQGLALRKIVPQILFYQTNIVHAYRAGMMSDDERVTKGTVSDAPISWLLYPKSDTRTKEIGEIDAQAVADVLDVLVPYLDDARCPDLARLARSKLRYIDGMVGAQKNFRPYEPYLATNETTTCLALIRYMFAEDPKSALNTMARVSLGEREGDTLMDRLTGKGESEVLQKLLTRSEWWAHLYVATMLREKWKLREPEILKRLEKDDHPLVKEKVAEIMSGK